MLDIDHAPEGEHASIADDPNPGSGCSPGALRRIERLRSEGWAWVGQRLADAARHGDIEDVRCAHECLQSVLAGRRPPVDLYAPALCAAAEAGAIDCLEYLIAAGARADHPDVFATVAERTDTALLRAVEARQPAAVRFLLEAGANPGATNPRGHLALEIAAACGDGPVCEALLCAGATPRARAG